jgi:hypothetical protein
VRPLGTLFGGQQLGDRVPRQRDAAHPCVGRAAGPRAR